MSSDLPDPPAPVLLKQWPLVREPGTASWILVASVGMSLLAAQATHSLSFGFACLLALWIAAWRCWLPIRYELGPAGVTQRVFRSQLFYPWSQFVRYEISGGLILLIRDADPNPLAAFRAVHLCGGEKHEAALAVLKYYLPGGR